MGLMELFTAKKIAGREVMLAVWELVTWNLASEAKRGASFAWLELTAEKDKAEILDSAVEIVNALLEGCKENESLFSLRLNLQDELYVHPKCLPLPVLCLRSSPRILQQEYLSAGGVGERCRYYPLGWRHVI